MNGLITDALEENLRRQPPSVLQELRSIVSKLSRRSMHLRPSVHPENKDYMTGKSKGKYPRQCFPIKAGAQLPFLPPHRLLHMQPSPPTLIFGLMLSVMGARSMQVEPDQNRHPDF